ncbi:hypothetical protein [Marinimicrobium agarilyticum]|uniref:hypothetical protein n=1 Tax=Marinimicrobium agarilyticum TaxID=306546 RepID=UPI0004285113|nr:hypothetical protein [Marinimicrobium agarilyticum]
MMEPANGFGKDSLECTDIVEDPTECADSPVFDTAVSVEGQYMCGAAGDECASGFDPGTAYNADTDTTVNTCNDGWTGDDDSSSSDQSSSDSNSSTGGDDNDDGNGDGDSSDGDDANNSSSSSSSSGNGQECPDGWVQQGTVNGEVICRAECPDGQAYGSVNGVFGCYSDELIDECDPETQECDGEVSGGEDCGSPPVCPDSSAECAMIKQQWLQRCPATGLEEFEGIEHELDMDQKIQEALDEYEQRFNQIKGDFQDTIGAHLGGGEAGIPSNKHTVHGQEIEIGIAARGDFFDMIRNLVYFGCLLYAFYIIMRA